MNKNPKNMKKISVLFLLLLSAAVGRASELSLRVNLSDGRTETYSLDEHPRISFDETNMLVGSDKLSASYSRDEVKSFDFVKKQSSSIDTAIGEETVYSLRDNVFTCEGKTVTVYSASGTAVAAGEGSVSLEPLARGLYIITVNNKSIKYIKR